jgi:hypothetical protein
MLRLVPRLPVAANFPGLSPSRRVIQWSPFQNARDLSGAPGVRGWRGVCRVLAVHLIANVDGERRDQRSLVEELDARDPDGAPDALHGA